MPLHARRIGLPSLARIVVVILAVTWATTGHAAWQRDTASLAALIDQAFRATYNLDHVEAIALGRRAIAMAPDEPSAHRALAAILWLEILFKRGGITVDTYLGSMTKASAALPKPPDDLVAEFKRELQLAISLAEARISKNPNDMQARYDAGTAYALQASFTASVEGSLTAALGTARRAYDAQETVLAREPQRARAGLVVGSYRYLVSGLSLPSRMVAYLAGFGGGKEKGIQLIETARKDPDARVDAGVALVLIYTKEGRHEEAIATLRSLEADLPRNRLLVLEEGSALLRAKRSAEAEMTLTRGLAAFDQDPRPKMPGERALWLYKRAAARIMLNKRVEAQADLIQALDAAPLDWVRGRIRLELGKLADLSGRRDEALGEYRQAQALADAKGDLVGSAEAGRLIRRPFALGQRNP